MCFLTRITCFAFERVLEAKAIGLSDPSGILWARTALIPHDKASQPNKISLLGSKRTKTLLEDNK